MADVTDHWWIEVDLATEAVPTLRGKFLAYTDFAKRGQLGPGDVVPRVLVTVPTEYRRQVMSHVVAGLPAPSEHLVCVVLHETAVDTLSASLLAADDVPTMS